MVRNQNIDSTNGRIASILIILNASILSIAFTLDDKWYWALFVSVPLLFITLKDIWQEKKAIISNFPEAMGTKTRQHLFGPDHQVKPFNRRQMPRPHSITKEIMEAYEYRDLKNVHPSNLLSRLDQMEARNFEQIYFKDKVSILFNQFHAHLN